MVFLSLLALWWVPEKLWIFRLALLLLLLLWEWGALSRFLHPKQKLVSHAFENPSSLLLSLEKWKKGYNLFCHYFFLACSCLHNFYGSSRIRTQEQGIEEGWKNSNSGASGVFISLTLIDFHIYHYCRHPKAGDAMGWMWRLSGDLCWDHQNHTVCWCGYCLGDLLWPFQLLLPVVSCIASYCWDPLVLALSLLGWNTIKMASLGSFGPHTSTNK